MIDDVGGRVSAAEVGGLHHCRGPEAGKLVTVFSGKAGVGGGGDKRLAIVFPAIRPTIKLHFSPRRSCCRPPFPGILCRSGRLAASTQI